jgi:basic membrane protein A and related proteins
MSVDYPARGYDQRREHGIDRRRVTGALVGLAMFGASLPGYATLRFHRVAASRFAAVLFIPYDADDLGFSEAAYRGYIALRHDGYRIDVVSNADHMDEKQLLAIIDRHYSAGARGFILAGAELSATTATAAARFPDAFFANLAGTSRGSNIINYCVDCRRLGGALAGQVAARESNTKIVGFVGGVESVDGGEAQRFRQSVLDAQPGATVLIDWTGDWSARRRAAQLTERQIRAGADIVVADANDAVIAAASRHRQVRAIGWMTDASRRYHNVVASVIIDTRVVFRRFIDAASTGRFVGGDDVITESDNVWKIVWPRR